MDNTYSEAVVGNKILSSQAPSNTAHTTMYKKVKLESKTQRRKIVQKLKGRNKVQYNIKYNTVVGRCTVMVKCINCNVNRLCSNVLNVYAY